MGQVFLAVPGSSRAVGDLRMTVRVVKLMILSSIKAFEQIVPGQLAGFEQAYTPRFRRFPLGRSVRAGQRSPVLVHADVEESSSTAVPFAGESRRVSAAQLLLLQERYVC